MLKMGTLRPCVWKGGMEGGIKQEERPSALVSQDATDLTRSDTLHYLGQHLIVLENQKNQKLIFFNSSVMAISFGFIKYFIREAYKYNKGIFSKR